MIEVPDQYICIHQSSFAYIKKSREIIYSIITFFSFSYLFKRMSKMVNTYKNKTTYIVHIFFLLIVILLAKNKLNIENKAKNPYEQFYILFI